MSDPKQKPQEDAPEQPTVQPAQGTGQPAAPITAEDVAEIFEEDAAAEQEQQHGEGGADPAEVTLRKQREWGPPDDAEAGEPAEAED
jgi:hypothetical protein